MKNSSDLPYHFVLAIMILLSLGSLIIALILFFCDISSSGDFLAAAAAFIAATVTLHLAKSSNDTASAAHKIALDSMELNIIDEGPVLRIVYNQLYPNSGNENSRLKIRNYGKSPAVNIRCELFQTDRTVPLFRHSDTQSAQLTSSDFEFAVTVNTDLLPLEGESKEFTLCYENFAGRRFENKFTLKERNVHAHNSNVSIRQSVYEIIKQKNDLVRS